MMRRWFGLGLLLTTLGVVVVPATGAPKDKKGNQPAAEPTDADTLPLGSFTGKLKTTPGSDGSFVLGVEYQHAELKNPKAAVKPTTNPALTNLMRDQVRIAQLQQQIATARTPQQAAQHMNQLQQAMQQFQLHQTQAMLNPGGKNAQQNPYVIKTETKDVQFWAAEEVKVRFKDPPAVFDEKGNIKKYTADELKELKGSDKTLPGYEGSVDKLQIGMEVKVTTVKAKAKPAPKKDADKAGENKDADKAADKAAADKDKAAADKDKDKAATDKDKDKAAAADKEKDAKPDHKTVVNLILVTNSEVPADKTPPKKKK